MAKLGDLPGVTAGVVVHLGDGVVEEQLHAAVVPGGVDPEIDQRFSFSNRSAIEKRLSDKKYRRKEKSDPDFRTKINPRFPI